MAPFLSHIDGGLWVCQCGHVREWHAGGPCSFGCLLGHSACKCEGYDDSPATQAATKAKPHRHPGGILPDAVHRRLHEARPERWYGLPGHEARAVYGTWGTKP